MVSTYTTRKRLNRQGTGDNPSSWGTVLNGGALDVVDFAMDGWSVIALSGNHSLTTADGTTTGNEAGGRVLKLTTATATWITTLPAREAWYVMWNATTAAQTIASSGGGTSVSIAVGEVVFVVTDAVNVKRLTLTSMESQRLTNLAAPTANSDAATKKYVDDAAFEAAGGNLPGQAGNAGKFLTTDGSAASWGYAVTIGAGLASVLNATVTVTAAVASDVRAGSNASKALTAAALMQSSAFQTLTDAATIAWNCANGYNARVTLTASGHTIGAPTGLYDGLCVSLEVIQDATGSRTVTWNSMWDFGDAGLPVLQTGAGKADRVFGQYNARTGKIDASYRKGA